MVCVSFNIPDVQNRMLGLKNTAIKMMTEGRFGKKALKLLYRALKPITVMKFRMTICAKVFLKVNRLTSELNRMAFLLSLIILNSALLSQ